MYVRAHTHTHTSVVLELPYNLKEHAYAASRSAIARVGVHERDVRECALRDGSLLLVFAKVLIAILLHLVVMRPVPLVFINQVFGKSWYVESHLGNLRIRRRVQARNPTRERTLGSGEEKLVRERGAYAGWGIARATAHRHWLTNTVCVCVTQLCNVIRVQADPLHLVVWSE